MDKVTCIAFLLYHSSKSQDIKENAIQLLNGDVTIRDLRRNLKTQALLLAAEASLRKNKVDKVLVQQFIEEFMLIEV